MQTLLPPVVVLPEPLGAGLGPGLSSADAAVAGDAIAALDRFAPFGNASDRDMDLCAAVGNLERLQVLQLVANQEGNEALPVKSPVQQYFMTRSADISAERAVAEGMGILIRSLVDLRSAPVSGANMAREVAAVRQTLVDFGGICIMGPATAKQSVRPLIPAQTSQLWYYRWIVAHQLHALFNINAAFAVSSAIESLKNEDRDAAYRDLRRATVYVEGFTSARAHALAIPSWFYNEVLRPSMAPPLSAAPLSGRMHLEYRAFRSQIARLLREFPLNMNQLAIQEPELALVREALLEADLIDAENHVCLIEPVIGRAKSLVQSTKNAGNALSMLRSIRDRRAASVMSFVRISQYSHKNLAGENTEISN